jgi:hypothetical protein
MENICINAERISNALQKCKSTEVNILRKINLVNLITCICYLTTKTSPSFRDIAIYYSIKYNCSISKQSIFNFFQKKTLAGIISKIITEIMIDKMNCRDNKLHYKFKRILLHDSTNIKLPSKADDKYSGMKNQSKEGKAGKIQAAFDIVSNAFSLIQLIPYRINDQKFSHELEFVEKNDLIIRDLGYFVGDSLKEIIKREAFFVSKIKVTTNLYDEKGQKIDLLKLLQMHGHIDEVFYLSKNNRIKVRVVAHRVPEEVGNMRRYKLKKDSRNNPSKESLELRNWNILVTNIFDEEVTPDHLFNLYKLRWKIELVFKTWKSSFNIEELDSYKSNTQIHVYLAARLLTIVILQVNFVSYVFNNQVKHKISQISFVSLMKNLSIYIEAIIFSKNFNDIENIINNILKFSHYEKRKKRKNYLEIEITTLTALGINSCDLL